MKIYVTRHGQTDGNLNRIMYGVVDIDINEEGIRQAHITKEKLKEVKFDLVICSPLIRAKHTMQIINENNYPVLYDDRIKERDCGEYTGKSFDSVDRDWYWNYKNKTIYEKAECIDDLFKRVYDFLDDIKEKYKDKTILIVTHIGVTKVMQCYFEGVPENGCLNEIGLNNCEVKIYEL